MSIQANGQMILTVLETITTGVPDVITGNSVITHNSYNVGFSLNANTSPSGQLVASISQAMTAGAATVNLASLSGTNGATVNGTGFRVIAILMTNAGSSTITVAAGASNGYSIFGASGQATLRAGETIMKYDPSGLSTAISSTNKNIDISGTGTDALRMVIVMG